jgi:hypothetical protein
MRYYVFSSTVNHLRALQRVWTHFRLLLSTISELLYVFLRVFWH